MVRSIISLTNTGAFADIILVNAAGTSVQLRQTVTGDGITITSGNGHSEAFIAMPERHLEGRDQVRTCLMPVPAGTTAAQAQAAVDGYNATGGCLWYRSSDDVQDILGANQLAGIASGKNTKSLADYETQFSVTNPDTGVVTPNLFRGTFFWRTAKADVDCRVASVAVKSPAAQLEQAPAVVTAPAAAEAAPF